MDTYPGGRSVQFGAPERAVAFWATGPGAGELRPEPVPAPAAGEVLVRTLWTGVSRGTESLVQRGGVPESEWGRMRAPFQDGEFPFPVKYGYLNVGVVEQGPPELAGRRVFTLFPHQSAFVVPAEAVTVVPGGVPSRRAVLAGAVETAVNVLWDAGPRLGDRIAVIGAGMIGCAVARLARGILGAEVTLVDVDESRSEIARMLGVGFRQAGGAPADQDVVIEASGAPEGLGVALRSAADDGEVVVASWYGTTAVPLQLGADFHSRRLTIRASQVGAVARARRDRRGTRERLALALRLLADPAFDVLLTTTTGEGGQAGGAGRPGDAGATGSMGGTSDAGGTSWRELPALMSRLAAGGAPGLCHTIDWEGA